MNATEWAAWIGGVTGVGGLVWDFYKWKTAGPKLKVEARAGIRLISTPRDDGTYVTVNACNVGSAATTITNLAFSATPPLWKRLWRKKPLGEYVVISPSPSQPIPHKLDVGEKWFGMAIQDETVDKLLAAGNLWCLVYHSWSEHPAKVKVNSL